ncbi:thioredoxin domain-containing protein [Alteromonas gracilis]
MTSTSGATRRSPLVPALVALVAVLITVGAFLLGGSETGEAGPTPSDSPPVADVEVDKATDPTGMDQLARRDPDDPMARGEADAPVVMIAWSEFQCPFCGKFARDTEPALIEKYVDEGTLRIEWRDFPYLGEESMTAAVAGRAAAEQGMFWELHDALFADQQPPNSGALTMDHLVRTAEAAGLDGERLRTDMADPELRAAVEADAVEGQNLGITGTPAFLINGEPVLGAQPLETFDQIVADAADAAR